ncbi:MAG: hypothetical protein ABIJ00_12280 [Candidatus Eisenbacteria bacterium]
MRSPSILTGGKSLCFLLALALAAVTVIGCEEDVTGLEKDKDEIRACEHYGTAEMTFVNKSSHSTYDVILDGSRIGSISPGHSISRTVAAGQHSFQFLFSNTGEAACYEGHPNLAMCQRLEFSCSNDL